MKHAFLALSLLALAAPAIGEIEKLGNPCETGICLYWWPKLPTVKGWHHEDGPSQQNATNILAPDGATFSDAETVMYAKASYKPRMPEIKTLAALIADDKKHFVENVPGVIVTEVKALRTGDGQKLRSFTFFPPGQGNWERVSYGEEGDFYLIFAVSSRTKSGYDKAMPAYEAMISGYKEKL